MVDEKIGFALLDDFRAMVRREVAAALKRDGHHKSCEGWIHYSVEMPPTLDNCAHHQQEHILQLYCYVLGPSRRYKWTAATASEVFAKATCEFASWVIEDMVEE